MTITPFLALKLRGKKDAIRARQRARRVASLLGFEPHEQTCIAAGTFVVACQALSAFGQARLCFQIEDHQLQVFAESGAESAPVAQRLAGLFGEPEANSVYRLSKPLPARDVPADEIELGWLVKKVEETASSRVFDEIVKQNQEILALLHELRLYRGDLTRLGGKSAHPDAA